MSKACKSNELYFFGDQVSGKRESNALVIHLVLVNSPEKSGVIHDKMGGRKPFPLKVPAVQEKLMYYQLVGEVKAHQGYDGYRA